MPSVLGIVPARRGSKGIPGKNVVQLLGLPLITYTLRTARHASTLTEVVVSTNDPEVAEIAQAEGVEVIRRPDDLAQDDSPTEDALLHVLETLEARGESLPEYVVTLEPTSPLRTPALIDRCVGLAVSANADAVLTVTETRGLYGRLVGDQFEYLFPGQPRRRQLREPLYRESSTVYVTRTAHLVASRSVLAEPLYAVIVSPREAVDINEPVDLEIAEALLRQTPIVHPGLA